MSTEFGYTDVIDKNLVKISFSVWLGQRSDWSELRNNSASVDEGFMKRKTGMYGI